MQLRETEDKTSGLASPLKPLLIDVNEFAALLRVGRTVSSWLGW